jgi:hypothetical protein
VDTRSQQERRRDRYRLLNYGHAWSGPTVQEKSIEQLTAEIKARYGIGTSGAGPRRFSIVLIRPSHYDADGYVVQWARCAAPSASLETLRLLAEDCLNRGLLGREVQTEMRAIDETTARLRPERLAKQLHGGAGLVILAGVQASQFTRAMDIALPLRVSGVHVCMQGFFVTANLQPQGAAAPGMREAMNLGIALLAGEPTLTQMESILRDAWQGRLQMLYRGEQPSTIDLEISPVAVLPRRRTMAARTVRLPPFDCAFATVVHIGDRTAHAVEQEIRANLQGEGQFLLASPRFSAHPEWEAILDRLIALREREKQDIAFTLQVDSACHRLPRFLEKTARAGVRGVFVDLSSQTDSISESRAMLLEWKRAGRIVFAGLTVGRRGESSQEEIRHVHMLQRELPIDVLVPACAPIPRKTIWEELCFPAWNAFYSLDHMETVLRRAVAMDADPEDLLSILLWLHCSVREKIDPTLSGSRRRRRHRRDRRPSMEREDPLSFYSNQALERASSGITRARLYRRFRRFVKRLETEPGARSYTDTALLLPDLPAAR